MTSRYRKPYRLKKRKSFLKSRFFWLPLLILIISGGFFYLVCFSYFFQVKDINISGHQEKVSFEQVKQVAEEKVGKKILFFPSRSIFLVNFKEINDVLLKNFPQIKKINFKRKFPDTLKIQIEERKPAAILVWGEKGNETYFFIDKEGVVYEQVLNEAESKEFLKIRNLFLEQEVKLGEKIMEEEEISQILEIKSRLLNDELKILIEEISLISKERWNAKTSENWEIYFNPKEDLNWQITRLKVILEKKIPLEKRKKLKYIDLRFEKVYIFPEGLIRPEDKN